MKLYTKITIGLVAGIIIGYVLNIMYDGDPFEAADKDQNGFLTIPEVLESDLQMYKDDFLVKSAKTDGKPSADDIAQHYHQDRLEYLQVAFPNVDLDQDKELTRFEILGKGGYYQEAFGDMGKFNRADQDTSGSLTLREVEQAFFYQGPTQKLRNFSDADTDKNQLLNRKEIVAAGAAARDLIERQDYYAADLSGDSLLTFQEYILAGVPLDDYVNSKVFGQADQNGDKMISRNEDRSVRGAQRFTEYTDPIGDIFIRLVKMVVVPLILASLILGAANLGDIRKLGSMGLKAFAFFTLTTAVAVTIGIFAANILRPGDGLPDEKKKELVQQYSKSATGKVESVTTGPQPSEFKKIVKLFVNMVPTNPIKALAEGDMLAIIFFALFAGLCITLIPPEKSGALVKTIEGVNEIVLKIVMLAMETAPYGVFALILGVVAEMGIDILVPLLQYGLVVVGALVAHLAITHFSFISFYLRLNPFKFLRAIKEALLLGFSTSSSSATLPISMNVTQKNLGVSNEVSSFVLPLGATINMDGTALYQGVAAIFIAQVYGIDLSISEQLIMVLTATLASVGAAGVPGAGMITLAVVLGTANIPIEGIALIFGLDRILDMFRTAVNITGDITCSAVMAKSSGEKVEIYDDRDMIPG